jgi:hypothetical protein
MAAVMWRLVIGELTTKKHKERNKAGFNRKPGGHEGMPSPVCFPSKIPLIPLLHLNFPPVFLSSAF